MKLLEISELMDKNNIVYAVIANLENGRVETAGGKEKLKYCDLVDTLFGDVEHIKSLNDSLEEQLMPRMWGQGEISCIVCKPADNILIGLFYHENREPAAAYRFSKKMDQQVKMIWNE